MAIPAQVLGKDMQTAGLASADLVEPHLLGAGEPEGHVTHMASHTACGRQTPLTLQCPRREVVRPANAG
jgi:predicted cobalt transporter CbtA